MTARQTGDVVTTEASGPGRARRGRRRAAGRTRSTRAAVLVAAGLLVVLAFGAAAAAGVRTFDVRTPSMGRTAPVGSLVVTVPPAHERLAVGDVVTFVPPTSGSDPVARLPYTHRITAITDGAITTKGDANGAADAWTIRRDDVVGRVVGVVPGAGWLLRVLLWLVGGVGAVWLLGGVVPRRGPRAAVRLLGVSAVVAVVVGVFRPFVSLLVTGVDAGARPVAHVVSTGLLPIRAVGPDAASGRLVSGAVGTVPLPAGSDGAVAITARLDLTPVGWVVLAVLCAVPLVVGVLLARPPRGERSERAGERSARAGQTDPAGAADAGAADAGATVPAAAADPAGAPDRTGATNPAAVPA